MQSYHLMKISSSKDLGILLSSALFQKRHFALQPFQSLETLDRHNRTHNDIKPQNFLMKFKNGPTDLTQIEIVLTDFGMAQSDSMGGTPIFASPECFEKKEKKSDIFSFGRVILFLLLSKKRFVKWLFVPIKDESRLLSIQMLTSNASENPLTMISKMTSVTDRINLQAARIIFDELRRQSNISFTPAFITAIDSVIKAEVSNDVETYVSQLCDFRYENSMGYISNIFPCNEIR